MLNTWILVVALYCAHYIAAAPCDFNVAAGFPWNPQALNITLNQTVCWTGLHGHNVAQTDGEGLTTYNGGFRSGDLDDEPHFRHRFTVVGTYYYMSESQPLLMQGWIMVRSPDESTPEPTTGTEAPLPTSITVCTPGTDNCTEVPSCPTDWNWCPTGQCVLNGTHCPCPLPFHTCWSGECVHSEDQCPLQTCPPTYLRCASGDCVPCGFECASCPTQAPTCPPGRRMCPTGDCILLSDSCPTEYPTACAPGYSLCASGKCVRNGTACPCPAPYVTCPAGDCVRHMRSCPIKTCPPSYLRCSTGECMPCNGTWCASCPTRRPRPTQNITLCGNETEEEEECDDEGWDYDEDCEDGEEDYCDGNETMYGDNTTCDYNETEDADCDCECDHEEDCEPVPANDTACENDTQWEEPECAVNETQDYLDCVLECNNESSSCYSDYRREYDQCMLQCNVTEPNYSDCMGVCNTTWWNHTQLDRADCVRECNETQAEMDDCMFECNQTWWNETWMDNETTAHYDQCVFQCSNSSMLNDTCEDDEDEWGHDDMPSETEDPDVVRWDDAEDDKPWWSHDDAKESEISAPDHDSVEQAPSEDELSLPVAFGFVTMGFAIVIALYTAQSYWSRV